MGLLMWTGWRQDEAHFVELDHLSWAVRKEMWLHKDGMEGKQNPTELHPKKRELYSQQESHQNMSPGQNSCPWRRLDLK